MFPHGPPDVEVLSRPRPARGRWWPHFEALGQGGGPSATLPHRPPHLAFLRCPAPALPPPRPHASPRGRRPFIPVRDADSASLRWNIRPPVSVHRGSVTSPT